MIVQRRRWLQTPRMKLDFAFSVTPAQAGVQLLHFQSGFRLEPVLDQIQYRNDGGG